MRVGYRVLLFLFRFLANESGCSNADRHLVSGILLFLEAGTNIGTHVTCIMFYMLKP